MEDALGLLFLASLGLVYAWFMLIPPKRVKHAAQSNHVANKNEQTLREWMLAFSGKMRPYALVIIAALWFLAGLFVGKSIWD